MVTSASAHWKPSRARIGAVLKEKALFVTKRRTLLQTVTKVSKNPPVADFCLCTSKTKEKYMFIVLVYRNGRQIRLVFTNKIEQQAAAALLKRYTLVVN